MSRTVTISAVFAVRDWRWLWLRKRRRRVVLAERVTGRELANGRARAAQVTVRRGKGWIEFADIAGVADVTLTREYEHPPETGFFAEVWFGTRRGYQWALATVARQECRNGQPAVGEVRLAGPRRRLRRC